MLPNRSAQRCHVARCRLPSARSREVGSATRYERTDASWRSSKMQRIVEGAVATVENALTSDCAIGVLHRPRAGARKLEEAAADVPRSSHGEYDSTTLVKACFRR